MELSEYCPPQFIDGTYTHEVTDPLENMYDCRIQFIGVDTRYPDDWEIWINGDSAFEIGRHRDKRGNTVYKMTAKAFWAAVDEYFESD